MLKIKTIVLCSALLIPASFTIAMANEDAMGDKTKKKDKGTMKDDKMKDKGGMNDGMKDDKGTMKDGMKDKGGMAK